MFNEVYENISCTPASWFRMHNSYSVNFKVDQMKKMQKELPNTFDLFKY